jgi:hypothetical protein
MVLRFLLWSLLLVHLVGFGVTAQPADPISSAEKVISRMSEATAKSNIRLRPFKVERSYRLFGKELQTTKSEVIAHIAYVPPDGSHYTIQKVSGSGLGEVLVRKVLESESDVLKHRDASAFSTANYEFEFLREDVLEDRPCYVLELRPRRKDSRLLRGTIWIDARSYLIRRAEGEPAKTPSWWARDIHIVLEFQVVNGMWIQSGLESTANIRLIGRHTMVARDMAYEMDGLDTAAFLAPTKIE